MSKFPNFFNDPNRIIEIPNFFSLKEIIEISNLSKNFPSNSASVGDGLVDTKEENSIRRSVIKWVPETESNIWLYNKLQNIIHKVNSQVYRFDLRGWGDSIQYTEYSETYKGKFDWHLDNGPNEVSHRKLSISVQLSEESDYEGGDFQTFPIIDQDRKSLSKSLGSLIIFPSFIPHRITPVTKGTRRSLVWWVGGAPFK